MPLVWSFRYYVDGAGGSDVREAYENGTAALRAKFVWRLKALASLPRSEWHEGYHKALSGAADGLCEICFKADQKQQRLLGAHIARDQFAILFWAVEKGGRLCREPLPKLPYAVLMKSEKMRDWSMTSGLPWSSEFVAQLSEKEFRDEFVADQVRTRIAQLVRVLREQPDRKWT